MFQASSGNWSGGFIYLFKICVVVPSGKVEEWKSPFASLGVPGAGLGVPGLVWACQGQSGEPGAVWDARANLGRQSQSGVPGPIWGARANLGVPGPVWGCQGQSGVPGPVQGARASPGCQSQSGVPRPVWGTKASQTCVLNHGCEPNCLCNSMCCAMLLHSNRSALVRYIQR